MINPF